MDNKELIKKIQKTEKENIKLRLILNYLVDLLVIVLFIVVITFSIIGL